MRVALIDPSLFTLPYDRMLALGLRDAGHDVVVTVQEYGSTAYGWAMEDTESRCVLVGDRSTGDLPGAHIVGPQAATLIQPLVQAMSLDTSLDELARAQYWIHPAVSEIVENALLGLHTPDEVEQEPSAEELAQ